MFVKVHGYISAGFACMSRAYASLRKWWVRCASSLPDRLCCQRPQSLLSAPILRGLAIVHFEVNCLLGLKRKNWLESRPHRSLRGLLHELPAALLGVVGESEGGREERARAVGGGFRRRLSRERRHPELSGFLG